MRRLQITAVAALPTRYGNFQMESFRFGDDSTPHLALSMGLDLDTVPVVRIHSECITGDVFGSLRCDCGDQLQDALCTIGEAGSGLVLYLRQEGRGIGIEKKLQAYALQEQGLDTVDANIALGLPVDSRSYDSAVSYMHHLKIRRCVLLTNNPDKVAALRDQRISVTRAPLLSSDQTNCRDYLRTKRLKLGHDC
ncbi:MAG: GTP cyclohydrolase II [Gammaproteobacteria bacterium]|nr:GTP cyclohydrolase II [Gammaproteobacteria bacterium]